MTQPDDRAPQPDAPQPPAPPAGDDAAATAAGGDAHQPPHPPFARSSDEYTDPPGHHRRGPHGPALDVGA